MTAYCFGPRHPLRPVRLERAHWLIEQFEPSLKPIDPGGIGEEELLRVHDEAYIDAVRSGDANRMAEFGFGNTDNPVFENAHEAALAYVAGSVAAAKSVSAGAPVAVSLSGGLHHAQSARASGFCVYNDAAIACAILKESFSRVAYIDIDLHHGDGVQELFLDDPDVLTFSIHQDGRTLYPGTGFVSEHGRTYTSLNVPLEPGTTGDSWLWALRATLLPGIDRFQPGAIVLQLGCDAHETDPLGHLRLTAQEWLQAVELVHSWGLPLVALGGGGYDLRNVPRMWAAAALKLHEKHVPETVPPDTPEEWRLGAMQDEVAPEPRQSGLRQAESTVSQLLEVVTKILPAS